MNGMNGTLSDEQIAELRNGGAIVNATNAEIEAIFMAGQLTANSALVEPRQKVGVVITTSIDTPVTSSTLRARLAYVLAQGEEFTLALADARREASLPAPVGEAEMRAHLQRMLEREFVFSSYLTTRLRVGR